MSADRTFEGNKLEEVLQEASAKLGIAEPDLDYRIIEQGRRGLFGIGARSVRIEVMPPLGAPDRRPAADHRPAPEAPESPAGLPPNPHQDSVESTLGRMIDLLGLQLSARAKTVGDGIAIELDGPDHKMLNHRDGELRSAFQFLLNRMARRTWPEAGRIQLARDGHRGPRDAELTERIHEIAREVTRSGKPRRMGQMNAYERRLVHLTIRKYDGLASRSEGNGSLKRVRIFKRRDGGGRRRRRGRRKPAPNA